MRLIDTRRHRQRDDADHDAVRGRFAGRRVRPRSLLTVVAMAVLAAVFAVPTAANAAWDETTTYAYNGGAWTNAIPSHSTQHWVRYMVQPSGFFEVYDRDSGAIVARGSGDGHWHTVYGLYNQHYAYQLHVWVIGNSGNYSRAWLDNCTSGCRNQGVWRPV